VCIYVRELTIEEGRKIQSILRRGKNAIQVRRAMVILSSAQGYKVPEIARMYYLSEKYVRELIHRFNVEGLHSLNPRYNGPKVSGGGSRTFSEEEKAQIIEIALFRPKDLAIHLLAGLLINSGLPSLSEK
jgi:transposase